MGNFVRDIEEQRGEIVTKEEFERRCLTFRCLHCHAEPQERCRDKSGRKVKSHSWRRNEVIGEHHEWIRRKLPKCPTCGHVGQPRLT